MSEPTPHETAPAPEPEVADTPDVPTPEAPHSEAPHSEAPRPEPARPEAAHQEGWLPSAPPRRPFESVFVRLVATVGVIAIGTLLGALLVANNVSGWIVGLTVSLVSVVLAAILWRTREL